MGFSQWVEPEISDNPPVYYPPALIDKALEINAGEVTSLNIRVGDLVEIIIP